MISTSFPRKKVNLLQNIISLSSVRNKALKNFLFKKIYIKVQFTYNEVHRS